MKVPDVKTSRSTRIVAATLITGSALFGLSPVASADPAPSDRTQTSQDSPKRTATAPKVKVASEPPVFNPRPLPSNAPKWLKRLERKATKFFQTHTGPFPVVKWEPGNTNVNIVCQLQGKC